jgi:hypothetical protein
VSEKLKILVHRKEPGQQNPLMLLHSRGHTAAPRITCDHHADLASVGNRESAAKEEFCWFVRFEAAREEHVAPTGWSETDGRL